MEKLSRPATILDDYMDEVKGHLERTKFPGNIEGVIYDPMVQRAMIQAIAINLPATEFVDLIRVSILVKGIILGGKK